MSWHDCHHARRARERSCALRGSCRQLLLLLLLRTSRSSSSSALPRISRWIYRIRHGRDRLLRLLQLLLLLRLLQLRLLLQLWRLWRRRAPWRLWRLWQLLLLLLLLLLQLWLLLLRLWLLLLWPLGRRLRRQRANREDGPRWLGRCLEGRNDSLSEGRDGGTKFRLLLQGALLLVLQPPPQTSRIESNSLSTESLYCWFLSWDAAASSYWTNESLSYRFH